MAKILDKIGITTGNTVEAYHVTQSIDAFTGLEEYDIFLSGSLNITGSIDVNGNTIISGSLDVNGNTIITGSLTVSGSAHTIDGNTTFNDAIFLNPISSITSGTLTPNNINKASITVNGTNSVTLADGTQGQLLLLFTSFVLSGTTTVTPTNAQGFASLAFNAVGDTATLMWMGLDWYLLSSHNVTVS